jgi:hypothetical protein
MGRQETELCQKIAVTKYAPCVEGARKDSALSLETGTALDPFGTEDVNDPMKNASIEELKSHLISDTAEI